MDAARRLLRGLVIPPWGIDVWAPVSPGWRSGRVATVVDPGLWNEYPVGVVPRNLGPITGAFLKPPARLVVADWPFPSPAVFQQIESGRYAGVDQATGLCLPAQPIFDV